MATKGNKQAKGDTAAAPANSGEVVKLATVLQGKREETRFSFWIVGDTPLITHAWSEKARREMLEKQVGATKAGREKKDPHADFLAAIYDMGDGVCGFPAMAIKNCILSAAHKDKGIARSLTMSALWVDAPMVRSRPALAGAICDMPLVRIWGDKPEMREDMVRVGSGLNKTATLAYRPQFTRWAMRVTGRLNTSAMTMEQLSFLVIESGKDVGLGEWRTEKKGMFGSFHLASVEEEELWEAHAQSGGKTPVPLPPAYRLAAE